MVAHFAQRLDMVNSSEHNHCYLLTKAVIQVIKCITLYRKKMGDVFSLEADGAVNLSS